MTQPPAPTFAKPRPAQLLRSRGLDPREFAFRAVIITLILGSAFGAWWTFMRVLPPLQLQSRQLASSLSKLSAEVDELDRQWSPDQIAALTNQYARVHTMLFSDESSFGEWLTQLNKDSRPLALDANWDLGKPTPVPAPGIKLAVVPATITLQVQPALGTQAAPLYQRILQCVQQLCSDAPGAAFKRADPVGLSVSGGLGSITNAVLTLELWAGEDRRQ